MLLVRPLNGECKFIPIREMQLEEVKELIRKEAMKMFTEVNRVVVAVWE